ncbi:MAG: metalloprotease family protein [Methanoregula sp.]|jgi:hypothetical protein|nr:metalloprotease family protein [Methanoregula sp.]
MDQNATSFLVVIGLGILVILISRTLDILWAQVIPIRFFYYIVRAPGVIVHELSHVFGCLIMGAKVKNVVLFSEKGGSVTYSQPKIPFLGDVVIGTAPLLCIPLVLAGCTWVFSWYFGCIFPVLPLGVDSTGDLFLLGIGVVGMFTRNLIVVFNPWFLLYLYITLTLVLSVAPSAQDIKNAAMGICIITLAGLLILWSSIPLAVSILAGIIRLISIGFVLGLSFGIIALIISFPLIILYVHKNL